MPFLLKNRIRSHTFESHAGEVHPYNPRLSGVLSMVSTILRDPRVPLNPLYRNAVRFVVGSGLREDYGPIDPAVRDEVAVLMEEACERASETTGRKITTGLLAVGPETTARSFSGWHADIELLRSAGDLSLSYDPTVLESPRSVIAVTGRGTLMIDGSLTIPLSELRLIQRIPGVADDKLVPESVASRFVAPILKQASVGLVDMAMNLVSWPEGHNPPGQYTVVEAVTQRLATMQPGTMHATHPLEYDNENRVFGAFD